MLGPTDISLTVRRARNLYVKGKGTNDAYATMEFEGEKFVTNVVEKSLSPDWHQECSFKLPSGGVLDKMTVTVMVFNKQHGKFGLPADDFIGQVKVSLSSLNYESLKEDRRWYSLEHRNPKKEKKPRGDIELGFKFISQERFSLLPDKKSPKSIRHLTSNIRHKLRRRSEDEDSGVGCDSYSMQKGHSMDNLSRTSSSASDTGPKKKLSIADFKPISSTRGLVKLSNKMGLSSHKGRATSVEVLNKSDMIKVSSTSDLKRSSSGGSSLAIRKQHVRNRSMPDTSLLAMTDRESPRNSVCINGPHIYITGSDSGNNSLNTSAENLYRSNSSDDIDSLAYESTAHLHASHNDNFSNSKKQSPFGEPMKSLSIVYKPKSYYRLDVKDLCKVSPIPEDPSVTFQQMDREQLLKLCVSQHNVIADKNRQIRELEDYIDKMLVKVMLLTPQILDRSPRPRPRTKF